MLRLVTALCVLLWIPNFCSAISVKQSPRFMIKKPGEPAVLSCVHDGGSSYDYIYWYQQLRGRGGLQLMTYSYTNSEPQDEKEFKGRLTTSRDGAQKGNITINSLDVTDTGMYFCAASEHEAQHFGEGTKLTVLEREILQPKVSIFEPSIKEIKQKKKATLVCVAYDFYPDHVSITWKMNGVAAVEGNFKTDDYPAKNDNLYSMSSRLRVHSSDYLNHEKRFQCIVNFMLNDANVTTTVREIPGKEACGVTPELHHKETNSAKFIYLLLLSKSSLYGFIILMVIIWHGKVSSDKNFK